MKLCQHVPRPLSGRPQATHRLPKHSEGQRACSLARQQHSPPLRLHTRWWPREPEWRFGAGQGLAPDALRRSRGPWRCRRPPQRPALAFGSSGRLCSLAHKGRTEPGTEETAVQGSGAQPSCLHAAGRFQHGSRAFSQLTEHWGSERAAAPHASSFRSSNFADTPHSASRWEHSSDLAWE